MLVRKAGGGAALHQQPQRWLMIHLRLWRGRLGCAALRYWHHQVSKECGFTFHWTVHWAEACHPSFCQRLAGISSLSPQAFIVAHGTLGCTMVRECGHVSSYTSECGLGRKRSNFKCLVHSTRARSALGAVYSGLNTLYLCEIRWWSSSLVWAISSFFLLDSKSIAFDAQTALQPPSSYSGATVGGV